MRFMDSSDGHLSPVRAVVSRTGVSAHLLRAWERRYGAIRPKRSSGGQRRYTEEDVERIRLLRDSVAEGHAISTVANLDVEELRELALPSRGGQEEGSATFDTEPLRREAFDAIERRDPHDLRPLLNRAALLLPHLAFLEEFLAPLLRDVGAAWERGTLGVAEEHLATRVVRDVVGDMLDASRPRGRAPTVLCTTPPGQRHEFGALLSALAASYAGWNSVYLGPDLPLEEVARLTKTDGARVVALSILHSEAGDEIASELRHFRGLLSPSVAIYVGGHANIHAAAGDVDGVQPFSSYSDFDRALRALDHASGGES